MAYKSIVKTVYNKINMPSASVHVLPDDVVLVIDEEAQSLELYIKDTLISAIIDGIVLNSVNDLGSEYTHTIDKYKLVAFGICHSTNWAKSIRDFVLKDFIENYCGEAPLGEDNYGY